jgi:hypothetical protein
VFFLHSVTQKKRKTPFEGAPCSVRNDQTGSFWFTAVGGIVLFSDTRTSERPQPQEASENARAASAAPPLRGGTVAPPRGLRATPAHPSWWVVPSGAHPRPGWRRKKAA